MDGRTPNKTRHTPLLSPHRSKDTGEDVAVKLIKRPLPKIILPNILREIRVSCWWWWWRVGVRGDITHHPFFFPPAPSPHPQTTQKKARTLTIQHTHLPPTQPTQIQADLGEGHINIIDAKEAVLTETHLGLVMEYAAGGSLTGYVAERWQHAQSGGLFLTEDEARYFMRQFVDAVSYCHGHCVAHRDLKLDNTLLDGSEPPMLKLCDFGFAKTWTEGANMFTHIGTPVYMSPELINSSRAGERGYDGALADVWASGVLLIVLLLGTFPFDHTEHPDPNTSEAHLEVWLQQMRQPWSGIPHIKAAVERLTPECVDLLNRIFVVDESKRITIPEIREHPWYLKPLSPKHAAAEARVKELQKCVIACNAAAAVDARLVAARGAALDALVEQAATRAAWGAAPLTAPLVRIDLSRQKCLGSAGGGVEVGGGGLGTLGEEEEAAAA